MEINKTQLQKGLEIVKPGLANKEIVEQTTSFAFVKGRVITYNDEISISHPVEGLELEGAVKADKLHPLLTKIKKEEINLEIVGNEVILKSGRIKAGLTLQHEIKLPLNKEVFQKKKWKPLPENFVKFMQFTMTSCSRDMSKEILTCVHVQKQGFIEGSDDLRITKCDLKEELPVATFLILATSAINVVRINPSLIAEGNGWMHFKNEDETIISCRTIDDIYPDTNKFINMKGVRLVLPRTIESALDRAMIFTKTDHILDEEVLISISNKRFKMKAEGDTGWFEETINLKYKGNPIEFAITPYLLKSILSETRVCEYTSNRLKFEGEGWVYITVLKNI